MEPTDHIARLTSLLQTAQHDAASARQEGVQTQQAVLVALHDLSLALRELTAVLRTRQG